MTQSILLEVEEKDMPFVIDLTQRLGIKVSGQRKTISETQRKDMEKFIMGYTNGFDAIPDPSAWQREIRKDRVLPFRD